MLRGLEGRRVALALLRNDSGNGQRGDVVRRALEQSGAKVDVLPLGGGSDEDWHGGRYAALVAIGGDASEAPVDDARLTQLAREFLVSEKPVAVMGDALRVIFTAGGAGGRTVAAEAALQPAVEAAGGSRSDDQVYADGNLVSAAAPADAQDFAANVVREFSRQLEDRDVDEMSEQSFPASDPPSTTPASLGHVAPDHNGRPRP